jgi:hypothetical protein
VDYAVVAGDAAAAAADAAGDYMRCFGSALGYYMATCAAGHPLTEAPLGRHRVLLLHEHRLP